MLDSGGCCPGALLAMCRLSKLARSRPAKSRLAEGEGSSPWQRMLLVHRRGDTGRSHRRWSVLLLDNVAGSGCPRATNGRRRADRHTNADANPNPDARAAPRSSAHANANARFRAQTPRPRRRRWQPRPQRPPLRRQRPSGRLLRSPAPGASGRSAGAASRWTLRWPRATSFSRRDLNDLEGLPLSVACPRVAAFEAQLEIAEYLVDVHRLQRESVPGERAAITWTLWLRVQRELLGQAISSHAPVAECRSLLATPTPAPTPTPVSMPTPSASPSAPLPPCPPATPTPSPTATPTATPRPRPTGH